MSFLLLDMKYVAGTQTTSAVAMENKKTVSFHFICNVVCVSLVTLLSVPIFIPSSVLPKIQGHSFVLAVH